MKRAFFGERALVGSLGKNSCPEHFSFVTQIYVTMEGPGRDVTYWGFPTRFETDLPRLGFTMRRLHHAPSNSIARCLVFGLSFYCTSSVQHLWGQFDIWFALLKAIENVAIDEAWLTQLMQVLGDRKIPNWSQNGRSALKQHTQKSPPLPPNNEFGGVPGNKTQQQRCFPL